MTVTIRYFAAIRERLGKDLDEWGVEEFTPATVEGVYAKLTTQDEWFGRVQRHLRCAVNLEFVDWDHAVVDGDEVAFIPPVSGGSGTLASADGRFLISQASIDPGKVRQLVAGADRGAVLIFEGTVRDHTGDREVEWLEYDAYPEMALKKFEECAAEAESRWPGVRVAIHHRWGRLEIGGAAVCTAVSHAHRDDAYQASRYVIDRLKETVPIWKKEVSPNGDEWIGRGP